MNKAAFLEDAKGAEGRVFGVPKCLGSAWGLPGMGGRAGPDNEQTCLLIVDGHVSHFTQGFLEYAKTSNIEVLCLPQNTTHALQSAIFL